MDIKVNNTSKTAHQKNMPEKGTDFAEENKTAEVLSERPVFETSSMTELLLLHEVKEYSFQQNESQVVFDSRSGDLFVNSTSDVNIQTRNETIDLELTIPFEVLGLDSSTYPKGQGFSSPIELDFTFQTLNTTIKQVQSAYTQNTIRKPQDVIADIADALYEIIKQPGDKKVMLSLDIEAMQSLLGNAKTEQLLDKVVGLLTIINSLRMSEEELNHYHIFVSGKGKSKVQYKQRTEIESNQININFKLKILPPKNTHSTQPVENADSAQD